MTVCSVHRNHPCRIAPKLEHPEQAVMAAKQAQGAEGPVASPKQCALVEPLIILGGWEGFLRDHNTSLPLKVAE